MPKLSQIGAIPLIALIALLGLLTFLIVTATFTFKDKIYESLFHKPLSNAASNPTISFNNSGSTCKLNIGPLGYQEITIGSLSTYSNTGYPTKGLSSNIYKICHDQFLKDIDFLGQNHISTIRLWPILSQFAYDFSTNSYKDITFNGDGTIPNINNFDEILNALAKNNIKARLTLNSMISGCGPTNHSWRNKEFYFNSDLVNNQILQDQYITSLKQFLSRYSNNPAIDSYDLGNELSYMVSSKGTICGWSQDPTDDLKFDEVPAPGLSPTDQNYLPNLKNFLKKIYSAAKQADPNHPVTFSFGNPYDNLTQTTFRDFFKDVVDFYDIHAYSQNPYSFYTNLPGYDKPLSHGEVGVGDDNPFYDSTGVNCYGDGWTWMNDECQQKFGNNTYAWIDSAKQHNVTSMFFHSWPVSRRYGARIYQTGTLNTVANYQVTKAGQYIIDLNQNNYFQGDVTVSGKIYAAKTKQPLPTNLTQGLTVETCLKGTPPNPTINPDGSFQFTVPNGKPICLRGPQIPGYSFPPRAVNRTATSPRYSTYEWQVAGYDCTNKILDQGRCRLGDIKIEDRNIDSGYDFAYTFITSPLPSSTPSASSAIR